MITPVFALEAQQLQLAVVEITCSVGLSEVFATSPEDTSTDIHSAGLIRGLDIFGNLAYDSVIFSDHTITVPSRGLEIALELGQDYAEVHTYARATVNRGFQYKANLHGYKSSDNKVADTCDAQLLLESLGEPPLDPTNGPILRSCSPECGSPIVLDLDRSGFEFTDPESGVQFDLSGGGVREQVAWIAAASEDAFLVLDRNENGSIDDGSELFGDATPQPASEEPNGYRALSVFDSPGGEGDGDGQITAADGVYHRLRLWFDRNHDGVAQATELATLASQGVLAISLEHVESRRQDRHGNELRYSSQVRLVDTTTRAVDVFLISAGER